MSDIRPPPNLTFHIFGPKSVKIRPLQNHSKCTPTGGSEFDFFAILDLPLGFGGPVLWDVVDFGT